MVGAASWGRALLPLPASFDPGRAAGKTSTAAE